MVAGWLGCGNEVGDIGEGRAWFETAELLIEDELFWRPTAQ
jgi:hypothetical protein